MSPELFADALLAGDAPTSPAGRDGVPYSCEICGGVYTDLTTSESSALFLQGPYRRAPQICGEYFRRPGLVNLERYTCIYMYIYIYTYL